jgi:hypothetical protein
MSPNSNPPITRWTTTGGAALITVGSAPKLSGGYWLVGLAPDGTHYVAAQDHTGQLTMLAGPISPGHALDVAERVLAGKERTVSSASLVMASALVLAGAVSELGGCAAAGEAPPC